MFCLMIVFFFFQAEDGIRDLVRSRGLGDVYKRQLDSSLGDSANVLTRFDGGFHDAIDRTPGNRSEVLSLIHI